MKLYASMNSYYTIDVTYLRPSRTIETILLENEKYKTIVYLFNRDGIYYYYFNTILQLIQYFDGVFECKMVFESEEELGDYLQKVDLSWC